MLDHFEHPFGGTFVRFSSQIIAVFIISTADHKFGLQVLNREMRESNFFSENRRIAYVLAMVC